MPRVYINATPIDVPDGSTAADAVRRWDAVVADSLAAGGHALTDSRGLPMAPDAPVSGGAIFRVLPARRRPSPASDP